MNNLIVTLKSWNVENANELKEKDKVNNWEIITDRKYFTAEKVKEKAKPKPAQEQEAEKATEEARAPTQTDAEKKDTKEKEKSSVEAGLAAQKQAAKTAKHTVKQKQPSTDSQRQLRKALKR